MKPQRLLVCGVWEGHKWVEIGMQMTGGGWATSSGQGLLGVTHWQFLPKWPEEMK